MTFFFMLHNRFSGTFIFESVLRTSFNIVTAFPILSASIFDRDVEAVEAVEALRSPNVYEAGRVYVVMNSEWVLETLVWSIMRAIVIYAVLWNRTTTPRRQMRSQRS